MSIVEAVKFVLRTRSSTPVRADDADVAPAEPADSVLAPPSLSAVQQERDRFAARFGHVDAKGMDVLIVLAGVPDTAANRRMSHQAFASLTAMNRMSRRDATGGPGAAVTGRLERALAALRAARANATHSSDAPLRIVRGGKLFWRILPPGEGGFAGFRQLQLVDGYFMSDEAAERLAALWQLAPVAWYASEEFGSRLYYVAIFPGVAVAESPDYGNALYYYECSDTSWQRVFSQQKQEALRLGAKRIVHTEEWEPKLKAVVRHGAATARG